MVLKLLPIKFLLFALHCVPPLRHVLGHESDEGDVGDGDDEEEDAGGDQVLAVPHEQPENRT